MDSGRPSQRPVLRWITFLVWGSIALVYLVYFLADLRQDFSGLQAPCAGLDCSYYSISHVEVAVLESWGLNARAYAWFMISGSILTIILYWALSGLLLWRLGTSRIGWTVSLTLVVIPIPIITGIFDVGSTLPQWQIPSAVLTFAGLSVWILFLYLVPNGRFYPRWAFLAFLFSIFHGGLNYFSNLGIISLPVGFGWVKNITLGTMLVALAPIFQFFRYHRHSLPAERQQIKWILFGMLPIIPGNILILTLFQGVPASPPGVARLLASIGGWALMLSFVSALPVTMAISILRYRLWDIDLIIRRTLQYTLLTGILAALYFTGVVLLQAGAAALIGRTESTIFIVLTTLGIVAVFNPIRRRTQNFIDRRFYRARYDSERTLQSFAATVRDEVDLDRLTSALLNVVDNTIQPIQIGLWLFENPNKHAPQKSIAHPLRS